MGDQVDKVSASKIVEKQDEIESCDNGSIPEETDVVSSENVDSTVPKELPSEGTPEKASKKATRGKRQKKEEKDENILPKADEKPAKRATKRNAVPITAEAKKIKPGVKKTHFKGTKRGGKY